MFTYPHHQRSPVRQIERALGQGENHELRGASEFLRTSQPPTLGGLRHVVANLGENPLMHRTYHGIGIEHQYLAGQRRCSYVVVPLSPVVPSGRVSSRTRAGRWTMKVSCSAGDAHRERASSRTWAPGASTSKRSNFGSSHAADALGHGPWRGCIPVRANTDTRGRVASGKAMPARNPMNSGSASTVKRCKCGQISAGDSARGCRN